MNWTPLIVSLVFQGFRLAAQAATGSARARAALSELEMLMLRLNEERRDPTQEEFAYFTLRTAQLDEDFSIKLEELRALVEGR